MLDTGQEGVANAAQNDFLTIHYSPANAPSIDDALPGAAPNELGAKQTNPKNGE